MRQIHVKFCDRRRLGNESSVVRTLQKLYIYFGDVFLTFAIVYNDRDSHLSISFGGMRIIRNDTKQEPNERNNHSCMSTSLTRVVFVVTCFPKKLFDYNVRSGDDVCINNNVGELWPVSLYVRFFVVINFSLHWIASPCVGRLFFANCTPVNRASNAHQHKCATIANIDK